MKFAAQRAFGHSERLPGKNSDTMSRLSRRSFLAASAALVAAPALGAKEPAADVDVVIVGAGAAGIAAARRVAAAKRSYRLLEASPRLGGRCATDTQMFGVPFDLGAHWIHNPDNDALLALAGSGLTIDPAARAQTLRVGPRPARDAEMESFLTKMLRARRAVADAGRKADMPAARALPNDLGDWQKAIEFILGPFACGKDLAQVSSLDLARAVERDRDAFCRQGYGALLAKAAADLTVRLSTPVSMIYWGGNATVVETPNGDLRPRAIILTASTNALTEDKIEFIPPLPKRQLDAAGKLSLGSYDHIALEIPGNPFDLQRDDLVLEQSTGPRTAALLANVGGTSLHLVEVAGGFGRDLAAKGEGAMVDFARDWLASLFGSDAKSAIKRAHATRWNEEPFVLGAMSAASPGDADARKILMEPLGGRIWFAGEAVHETQWGTVAGAWASGERAAEAALRKLGALKQPSEEREQGKPARNRRRRGGND